MSHLVPDEQRASQAEAADFALLLDVNVLVDASVHLPRQGQVIIALDTENNSSHTHNKTMHVDSTCMYIHVLHMYTYLAAGSEDGISLVHVCQRFLCLCERRVHEARMDDHSLDVLLGGGGGGGERNSAQKRSYLSYKTLCFNTVRSSSVLHSSTNFGSAYFEFSHP